MKAGLTETEKVTEISNIVCNYFEEEFKNVSSRSRKRAYIYPRQLIFYFSKKHTKLSLEKIGRTFSDFAFTRDHTTVRHSIISIENLIETNQQVYRDVNKLDFEIRRQITNKSQIKATPEEKVFFEFRRRIINCCRVSKNKEILVNELIAIL